MNAATAAEIMLESGLYYTSVSLGRKFRSSEAHGSRCLRHIKTDSRYQIDINVKGAIKVMAIGGRTISIEQLQNQALKFKRPALLMQSQIR